MNSCESSRRQGMEREIDKNNLKKRENIKKQFKNKGKDETFFLFF